FSTRATFRGWQAAGLNPYTDNTHKQLRGPEELIKSALAYAGTDQNKLGSLFPNKIAFKAVRGFQDIYREPGGRKAGMDAVDAEFRRLANASMAQTEVDRAFAAQMSTTEAQVAVFNNELQAAASQLTNAFVPALVSALPAIANFASSMANVISRAIGA